MKNTIEIQNTAKGVMLTFSGSKANTEILPLFGALTIPAPFARLTEDSAAAYVREVRKNFPGYAVEFV